MQENENFIPEGELENSEETEFDNVFNYLPHLSAWFDTLYIVRKSKLSNKHVPDPGGLAFYL